ncbi:hypothetical protein AYK86_13240 [Acinetobacter venetianus]|jgi:hypothetical protein|uniref:EsvE2 n=2 Tax=Acinetobacter venetianus TaxID=52133 RepID=N8ZY26_ACIVR|nr:MULTISPECIES: hypothetical protein [Acinetobacter]MDA0695505.1 hypothetical protein [Pseudomonadota bacterium]ENV36673.1 hypothetical protein F959_02224 [Acinetobacter venetianus RAG-1 = CIP 110063]KXO81496.1 hypothetical protein AYL20_15085 [Acinetobacter venetianus]KXO86656.1 hypothetical protein AYK86_13240 [Acinetobacter venetianus]KXZ67299.1 hypothetical protein AVENLUH7437_00419 [Acinetobacter venetianus]|tara:strand:- start:220 stop:879 length:660 start_codon:yes stop_codon:yes gene_type:complete
MTSYFGILPSASLSQDIQLAQANRDSKEPQYPLRDKISLQLTDELIDTMLVHLVQQFPPSEKRDTTEGLAIKIRGIVETLMKQLLGKASNEQVLESLAFMEKSLFVDNEGQQRIGAVLPDSLVADMKKSFAEVAAGNGKEQREALTKQFKAFADALIQHFMTDFNKTLGLGMVKRGVASVATSGVETAVHIVIKKLIPSLSQAELDVFTKHFDQLLVQK